MVEGSQVGSSDVGTGAVTADTALGCACVKAQPKCTRELKGRSANACTSRAARLHPEDRGQVMVKEKLWRLLGDMLVRRSASGGCEAREEAHGVPRRGVPRADPLPAPRHSGEKPGSVTEHGDAMPVDVEEVDRLVRLTFDALLEREADQDTVLAYREGFANGTTFRDLIDDVVASAEYAAVRRRIRERRMASEALSEVAQGRPRADEMQETVQHLATRLNEKGCRLRFDPVSGPDQKMEVEDCRRLRSLLATLSMLGRL